MQMEKVLVTGGGGYIGACLVPKLLELGYSVRVFDLFLFSDESIYDDCRTPNLEIYRGNLANKRLVQSIVQRVDHVIHLAGVSNDPSSDLSPDLTREVNIRATEALIDAAKEAGVRRFLNASSSSVYGVKDAPNVTEDLPLEPLTVYSESKVKIEQYLAANRGSMKAASVRSATVCGYSPRMRLDLTVNILTHHALRKGKITVFGGSQKRPNIHIDDVCEFYCQLLDAPADKIDGEAFNVCGSNHTVAELATMVQQTVAPEVPIVVEPTTDLRSYHISAEKAFRVLGFSPRKTILDAIRSVASAIEDGRIRNPDRDCHYNVRAMKKLLTQDPWTSLGL
jgi:nucleoside-diphosphate-sugar epimerase